MAWLRVLMVMLLIGGTASAERQPPRDFDDRLFERESVAPQMRRPPPPIDPNEMLHRRVVMATAQAAPAVEACARRFRMRIDHLDVRVTIGFESMAVGVPRFGESRFVACVRGAVHRSLRAAFGNAFRRRPALVAAYRFTFERREVDGFAQPPP